LNHSSLTSVEEEGMVGGCERSKGINKQQKLLLAPNSQLLAITQFNSLLKLLDLQAAGLSSSNPLATRHSSSLPCASSIGSCFAGFFLQLSVSSLQAKSTSLKQACNFPNQFSLSSYQLRWQQLQFHKTQSTPMECLKLTTIKIEATAVLSHRVSLEVLRSVIWVWQRRL